MERIPSAVRLPGLTIDNLPNAIGSAPGLLEKDILNYWETIYNQINHQDNIKSIDDDDTQCVWLREPLAVIGTVDSANSEHEALKAIFQDSGLSSCQTPCLIFTTTSEANDLSELTLKLGKSIPNSESVQNAPKNNSIACLQSAMKKLEQNCTPNLTCLIFQKDTKNKISVLALKRISQAISNGDKVQAVLGPGIVQSNSIDIRDSEVASIEILHLVEIVRFLNLRGPFVNQPWLDLQKLRDTHKRESAVIPHLFPDDPTKSLVISKCSAEEIEKIYPKWTLSSRMTCERSLNCFALQHENLIGLEKMCENLKNYLNGGNYCDDKKRFPNLAYTLNTKLLSSYQNPQQEGSKCRAVIIAKDATEASKVISTKAYLKEETSLHQKMPKLCFLFTGQGSQYPGMAKILYESCPVFHLSLNRCNKFLRENYNINILEVMWENSKELSRTLYSQTSIFCVEYALLQTWKSWGIEPDVVVGHSLGEFCAAVACGALEMEDALKLVAERSRLIDQLPRGKMLVLRADHEKVKDFLVEFGRRHPGSWLDFAAINSKDQTVLSGDIKWVDLFAEWVKQEKKVMALVLEATHAFHSRHMDPMLEEYRKVAEGCHGDGMAKNGCVFISGMDGKVVRESLGADYWVRHTREPVRFVGASKVAWEEVGARVFLEVGPQPILMAMVKVNTMGLSGSKEAVFLPSIRKGMDDWKIILNGLAKLWMMGMREVDWRGFERFLGRTMVEDDVSVVREIQMI